MAALAAFLDAALGELRNAHRGASAPDSPIEGQRWWDTSGGATAEILKRYTVATGWVSILTMNVTTGTITAIHGILDENDMASDSAVLPPSQQSVKAYVDSAGLVSNLKPVVNAAVNKLDVFTKSGGAAPDATNVINVSIPDGNGYTSRSRAAAYLSGTGQIILADAANYWSKGSLDGEIKTAWLYAIWDGTGIVWALAGYSGFTQVPTTTTVTDDDYFLLEASSTYTRSNAHYCVAVAKIRYQYDTADTPDHTIQATVIDAPQVIWNPKSDYSIYYPLTANVTSGSDIADAAILARAVKQSGKYLISASVLAFSDAAATLLGFAGTLKVGGSTYAGGTTIRKIYAACDNSVAWNPIVQPSVTVSQYLNTNDIVWLGGTLYAGAGNRVIDAGGTHLTISRED
jgi:hypothetical protein